MPSPDDGAAARLADALRGIAGSDDARLCQVLAALPIGAVLLTGDGTVAYVNPAMRAIVGMPEGNDETPNWLASCIPVEELATVRAILASLLRGEDVFHRTEHHILRLDGGRRFTRWVNTPLRDAGGAVSGVICLCEDITDDAPMLELARAADARLHAVLDAEPACVQFVDRHGVITEINSAGLALHDVLSPDEIVGRRLSHFVRPEHRDAVRAAFAAAFDGERRELEYEMQAPTGRCRWIRSSISPLWHRDGSVLAVLAVSRDTTEERHSRERSRESATLLRLIAEAQAAWIEARDVRASMMPLLRGLVEAVHADWAAVVPLTSEAMSIEAMRSERIDFPAGVLGAAAQTDDESGMDLDRDEALNRRGAVVSPTSSGVWRAIVPVLAHGELVGLIELHQMRGNPLLLQGTTVVPLLSTAAQLLYGHRTVRQFRTARLMLEEAQHLAHLGSWQWDIERQAVEWSDETYRIVGRDPREFRPTHASFLACVHEEDRQTVDEALADTLATGREYDCIHRVVRPDGSVRYVHGRGRVDRGPDGAARLLIGTAQDVTERVAMQDQLAEAARMEAMGRLAGGIAHDFGNLLTVISGQSGALREHVPADAPAREHVEEIRQAAERGGEMTRRLLAYSRRQVLHSRPLSLNDLVTGVVPLLRRLLDGNILLDVTLGDDVPAIEGDEMQLERVLLNLASNARDAMPHGGTLRVCTRVDGHGEHAKAVLEVIDTGVGMTADQRRHIFDPFFTTKHAGEGTGLGLAIVAGVVHQLNGDIAVDSTPGVGSRFILRFPVTSRAVAPAGPSRSAEVPHVEPATILVAEDEASVQKFIGNALVRAGHEVLLAPDGDTALRVLLNHPTRIDVLVADIVMPHVSGIDVARRARERWPDLGTVFISGHATSVPPDLMAGGRAQVLQKPFDTAQLLTAVHRLIGEGRSSARA